MRYIGVLRLAVTVVDRMPLNIPSFQRYFIIDANEGNSLVKHNRPTFIATARNEPIDSSSQ